MSEGNKAIIPRLVEELWSEGNLSIADEFFSQNYTHHDPSTPDLVKAQKVKKTSDILPHGISRPSIYDRGYDRRR
jgi:hypothetical protein